MSDAKLEMKDSSGTKVRIVLDGDTANITAGGQGRGGDVLLKDDSNKLTVWLNAGGSETEGGGLQIDSELFLKPVIAIDGRGSIKVGGQGQSGDLWLNNAAGAFTIGLRAVENDVAGIWVGGKGQKGLLILRNGTDKNTVALGGGETGDLYLQNKSGEFTLALRAVENDRAGIWVGGKGQHGQIVVRNGADQQTIYLDGKEGDIVLQNADCAEEFEITGEDEISPGTVMVIQDEGRLHASAKPYDRRVAGIISGGSDFRPAIVLGHQPSDGRRLPIALAGRVMCNVDSQCAAIDVGDLLTTSPTPGHAMKAVDLGRAFGAIIGKALCPLSSGRGAIPVLVTLQ